MTPDREFLTWLAGFFDGEGWVSFRNRPEGRHFILGVAQSGDRGKAICEEIRETMGVGKVTMALRKPHYLNSYSWRVERIREVLSAGTLIRPFLKVKGTDLDEMLALAAAALPSMPRTVWTLADEAYLRSNYRNSTLVQMGIALGRSPGSIDGHLSGLGIGKRRDAR